MLLPMMLVLGFAAMPAVEVRQVKGGVEVVAPLTGRLLADVPEGKLTQEQGQRWLTFCLVDPDTKGEGPPIFGAYRREGAALRFVPRHALTAGQRYRATVHLGGERGTVDHLVPVPEAEPAPVVTVVYPTADVLPANLLKFYIHFSQPMRETKAIFDQMEILDDKGRAVADPWRRTELWSADSRRLTLWIHPGRIKRGVGPRETEGPVLQPNRQYTFVISGEVASASGQRLGKPFRKAFRTSAEDRSRPLPESWKVQPGRAGSREPLVILFGEPLDRALLERFLLVRDEKGRTVAGRMEVGKEERSWQLHPEAAWEEADYTLTVDGQLEDVAGNTPERVFDRDLDEPEPKAPVLLLRFRARR